MRNAVKLVEVGPRDGLQNEAGFVPTALKIELIERLQASGLTAIETTSFVSPRWVPQMRDHKEVVLGARPAPGSTHCVLVPNLQGFEAAAALGVKEVAVFASATQTFSQKNINCSIEESLERFAGIFDGAQRMGVRVRGYVSCVVGCPYEGAVAPENVARVAEQLYQAGCYEISLGDTTGVGHPSSVAKMLDAVSRRVPMASLAGHFHDTFGMALLNILESYRLGMRVFDSSIGALGGCPYAIGASGNVATEDVAHLFQQLGVSTGVDLPALVETAQWIAAVLGQPVRSKVAQALGQRSAVSV